MDLGKKASAVEIQRCLLTSLCGGTAHMSDAYGLLCEYRDTWKRSAALMHLIEECCIVHSGK